ncbi:hypothetical protein [Geminocystis sp. NIES-3709]|uniref:type IIG restriction enzyme/methyltransferase n=1 Tax=Geminocystis sp. NIES-3709 TaxID=1617448 RepID=UPI0005FCA7DD|nr:hypothetical protein [Geminocystis sp. NIES-3709]BAQ64607.1 putative type IIS restriction/modification enzyme [Geminocystis sp. NIES-3709]
MLYSVYLNSKVHLFLNSNGFDSALEYLINIRIAIYHLELYNKLSNLTNLDKFGTKYEEQLFGVALELVITWINRILFLKLLEAQLVNYNNNDKKYTFLQQEKIANFNRPLAKLNTR